MSGEVIDLTQERARRRLNPVACREILDLCSDATDQQPGSPIEFNPLRSLGKKLLDSFVRTNRPDRTTQEEFFALDTRQQDEILLSFLNEGEII